MVKHAYNAVLEFYRTLQSLYYVPVYGTLMRKGRSLQPFLALFNHAALFNAY